MFSVDWDEALQGTQAKAAIFVGAAVTIFGSIIDLLPEVATFLVSLATFAASAAHIYVGIRKSKRADERQKLLVEVVTGHLDRTTQIPQIVELDSPRFRQIGKAIVNTNSDTRPLESIQELQTALDELEKLDK